MIMQAVVLSVHQNYLLVLDLNTRQKVQVNTPRARQFRPGNIVRIRYNGIMTKSIPPQINAQSITALPLW